MANQMKFSGIVTAISEPLIGENGKWQSVTVVVTEDKDQYPQSIAVECFNKQSELDKIALGVTCDVHFNMEASEYKGKYYGKNKLWKFENAEISQFEENRNPAQNVTSANDNEPPF